MNNLVSDEVEGWAGGVEGAEGADQFLEEERAGLSEGDLRDLTDESESQALQQVLVIGEEREASLAERKYHYQVRLRTIFTHLGYEGAVRTGDEPHEDLRPREKLDHVELLLLTRLTQQHLN